MKAIITIPCQNGTYDEVGMSNRFIMGPYKLERNLLKGLKNIARCKNKKVRVEFFRGEHIVTEESFKTLFVNC